MPSVPVTRPPRPARVDADLLAEAARLTGMKPREILDAHREPDGLVVTTHDGAAVIVLTDSNDVLFYPTSRFPHAPKGTRVYLRDDLEPAAAVGEAWTVADLDLAASKVAVPSARISTGRGRASYGPFVDGDPVKARAVWLALADKHGATPGRVADRDQEAAEMRRIVVTSGLLAESEVSNL